MAKKKLDERSLEELDGPTDEELMAIQAEEIAGGNYWASEDRRTADFEDDDYRELD